MKLSIYRKSLWKFWEKLYNFFYFRLYLLRRGVLLGVIIQHPDDLDSIRCLFLNSIPEDAKRFIEPTMLMNIDEPIDSSRPFMQVKL